MDEWFSRDCAWPDFKGLRLLVVGIGGGCDVILAYAITSLLSDSEAAEIVYANTKRRNDGRLVAITPHVARVSDWRPELTLSRHNYGTTAIEHSLPRGDRGCPFVLLLPDYDSGHALCPEIQSLGFDVILAVDTGGDSIVDTAISGDSGRDKQMLRVLKATGLPLLHIIVAPGSDGESGFMRLQATLKQRLKGTDYLGCFALDPVIPLLRELAAGLSPSRTPNIIVAAAENRLPGTADGWCTVPREACPDFPREYLTHAFVLVIQG